MKVADKSMERTKALPAAAASAVTDVVDLGATEFGPVGANLEVQLSVEATPSLVDDKTITFTFEDSADDSSYAQIVGSPTYVVTGASSAGAAAAAWSFRLPQHTRRYLKAKATVLTGGGSNIAKYFTLKFKV